MGFLRRLLFGAEEKALEPIDLGLVGTDMHSHLLPGIDDGAQDMEQSMMLIEQLHAFGYKKFITTPHVYRDIYPNTSEIILSKLELVRKELAKRNIDIEFHAAAEYFCDEAFEEYIEAKTLLTLGPKNYVLFEISFDEENANMARAIFNMHLNGYKPILAHPERYAYWHHDFSKYESMLDKDVHLQININSLTGQYGPMTKHIAERLIQENMVSFIGTDCHHMGHIQLMQVARQNPYLHKLIESGKLLNHELLS